MKRNKHMQPVFVKSWVGKENLKYRYSVARNRICLTLDFGNGMKVSSGFNIYPLANKKQIRVFCEKGWMEMMEANLVYRVKHDLTVAFCRGGNQMKNPVEIEYEKELKKRCLKCKDDCSNCKFRATVGSMADVKEIGVK